MHSKTQDTVLGLRVSSQLLADARAEANRRDVSFSKFVRDAIRREVEAINIEPRPPSMVMCPPPAPAIPRVRKIFPNEALGAEIAQTVAAAAKGHVDSQRYLFNDRLQCLLRTSALSGHAPGIAAELITFGRLLISHGHHADLQGFACALIHAATAFALVGNHEWAAFLQSESITVLDQLAELGDDLAAVSIDELSRRWPAQVMKNARDLRKAAGRVEEAA